MKRLLSKSNKNFVLVFIILSVILIGISHLNFKWDAIIVSLILADLITDLGLGRSGGAQVYISEKITSAINYCLKTLYNIGRFISSKSKQKIQDHKIRKSK